VESARIRLDAVTAGALTSDVDDIAVDVVAKVNRDVTIKATLMLGPHAVESMKPVMP
jgi:hypothetical protein